MRMINELVAYMFYFSVQQLLYIQTPPALEIAAIAISKVAEVLLRLWLALRHFGRDHIRS